MVVEKLVFHPLSALDLNTALIFLEVSLVYHSLIMFKNGVKSLSVGLSESTPLFMAINLIPFSGNSISVKYPTFQ